MYLSLALAAQARGAFPACDLSMSTQTVSLIHVTDLHARYHPGPDGISPYARLRGYFDAVRETNAYALFVNGGDDHEKGSVAEQYSKGQSTRDMTRAMGFDVRVLGNHDFAWGTAATLDHARDPRAVVLASNIRYDGKAALSFGATNYVEIEIGCVTLGFVGPITMPWNADDEPFSGQYPGFRANYNYAAQVRRALKNRRKADAIIALSHLGREHDIALAKAAPGIDLILGGHTHGWTWDPLYVNGTAVIESGFNAQFLSHVELDFDPKTRRLTGLRHDLRRVKAEMPVEPVVQALALETVARWKPAAAGGCACRDADKKSAAEAAARAAVSELDVDVALLDHRTIWAPWKAGALDAQDFSDAFTVERQPPDSPGFSAFYRAKIDGAALAKLIKSSDPDLWSYAGRRDIAAGRVYRLALPKRAALNAERHLPAGTRLNGVAYGAEVWATLVDYAARRRAAGLCVDDGCAAN